MQGVDFVAIDFETATSDRASICEAGICVVRDGKIVATQSWFVRPPDNKYFYRNIEIHHITPQDTESAPPFPVVWREIMLYLEETPTLVAHNAVFDISCIRNTLRYYNLDIPDITYYCTLRAARHIYDFSCNKLNALCDHFEIPYHSHHRACNDAEMCARLFLRQLKDCGHAPPEQMQFCIGKL